MNVEPTPAPFTVLIDTAEDQPFLFEGLTADANKDGRPLTVRWRYQCLGRHPHSLGDYSIEGFEERIAVERKSMEDAQATVLGWTTKGEETAGRRGHRQRFERELHNLSVIDYGLVVVEATLGQCAVQCPEWGVKPAEENGKIFHRSVLSYMRRFSVPWLFCDSRRHAEKATYSWLYQCWRAIKQGKP